MRDLNQRVLILALFTRNQIGKEPQRVKPLTHTKRGNNMGKNKIGWGAAKEGKVHDESKENYSDYKVTVKSSKDLKGLYGVYQGKTLSSKGK